MPTPRRGLNLMRALRLIWLSSPGPVTGLALITVGAGLVPAAQIALTARLVQAVADTIAGSARIDTAVRTAVLVGLVTLVSSLLSTAHQYTTTILQMRLANSVSRQILEKAARLDLEHFENDKYYDGLQRAGRESSSRPYQLVTDLMGVIELLITLAATIGLLSSWDPRLALIVVIAPVPSLIANLIFARKSFDTEFQRAPERRRVAYLHGLLTNDRAVKEIRLLQLTDLFVGRYREAIDRFHATDRSLVRRQTFVAVPLSVLSVAITAGSMICAVLTTVSAGLIGQFTGFVQAIARVQTAVSGLLGVVGTVYRNTLFVGNLFDFLDLPESGLTSGNRPFPARLRIGIEFRDVRFRYPGSPRDALDGVSFLLPAGRCVAVVGANGAGKTTLVKLLTRLYQPTSGTILIDGVPIEEYDVTGLRRNIGVIFQDFVQYETTVQENIGFGRVEDLNDRDRVRRAAVSSRAETFLEDLPEGYDSMLGRLFENGSQLSLGQWQKVALARAFIRQAPVMVLDEPTASIDAEAEEEIFGRFRTITSGTTALLIAHRFSTVRIADHIIVIQNRRVAEQGSHDELLAGGGLYARLFRMQAAGYVDSRPPVADVAHAPS
jgi:ATP-binding cassette subfamily B protein